MEEELLQLLHARKGHFAFESGHHGDLWLDLELLYLRPASVDPLAAELGQRLARYELDAVCGPLIEGAFVALAVARNLDVQFHYTLPSGNSERAELYPVTYQLPDALRDQIGGKRVAIVNDVVNAGSAVRGTYQDLESCGAEIVVIAALLALGDIPKSLARQWNVDLIALASQPNSIWAPEHCPLCATGIPLTNE